MLFAELSRPTLRELYEKVTPHFAKHWKRIGVFLNMRSGELDALESDFFRNCQECCDRMLAKWLDVDTTASWEKLKNAVTLAMSPKGMANVLSIYLSQCHISTHTIIYWLVATATISENTK